LPELEGDLEIYAALHGVVDFVAVRAQTIHADQQLWKDFAK
jgi:hypothetical protein